MRVSFIGRGPEAHAGREALQDHFLVSARDPQLPASLWEEMIHSTDVSVLTTTEEGWPLHLHPTVGAILDVAGFKSRRHGILFVGDLDPAALHALRQREDLCWYAHAPSLDGPFACDDLEGQRILARLGHVPVLLA